MTQARLRFATIRDLPLLVRNRRRMWEDMGGRSADSLDAADRVYRRWARARLRSRRLVGFIVETAGGARSRNNKSRRRAVASGCVWLQEIHPRPEASLRYQPYLLSMFTEPDARGAGHARAIVRAALAWCLEHHYPRIELHASDFGRKLYASEGFAPTHAMRLDL